MDVVVTSSGENEVNELNLNGGDEKETKCGKKAYEKTTLSADQIPTTAEGSTTTAQSKVVVTPTSDEGDEVNLIEIKLEGEKDDKDGRCNMAGIATSTEKGTNLNSDEMAPENANGAVVPNSEH